MVLRGSNHADLNQVNITADHLDDPLPPAPFDGQRKVVGSTKADDDDFEETEDSIATWTYCRNCAKVVTPLVYILENTWKYSFGKFFESFFYNWHRIMNLPLYLCRCNLHSSAILFFGCGQLAARFTYKCVCLFGVSVRQLLLIDVAFHCGEALCKPKSKNSL